MAKSVLRCDERPGELSRGFNVITRPLYKGGGRIKPKEGTRDEANSGEKEI